MLVGYARVSSTGQDLAVQEEALRSAGCDRIFSEKRSGRSASDRPALQEAIEFARSGDTILVTRLDRWARSTQDLHNLLARLDEKGVGFTCLAQSGVDTTNSTGKLVLAILGAVAAFETDLRAERQREGIAKAREVPGKYRGRSPSINYAQVRKLHDKGVSPSEIAALLQIGRTSVYRALKC
ncbi:helix-turn-helix domain-containing protein [Altererythrobacter soli]|uniref:Helix-turn-helix domain-containing protein n=1 Tax=Croceibacterium soli TaxID=1739690 RepID=A0A6I4UVE2_9SPHN|nr:recombinase family protein [Croceibacterium soli]MXP42536.1 helix-turn-helix domain-containing protein [Croceibacterium soli]